MPCCQVSKTESLNSICDVARANDALWRSMGVTPPMRNTFANANAHRPADMAKDLYWKAFNHRPGIAPKSGRGPHRGYCFRIKAPMFAVDTVWRLDPATGRPEAIIRVGRGPFDVTVDRAGDARSALGGTPLPREAEWWAEHLVLAGLVDALAEAISR